MLHVAVAISSALDKLYFVVSSFSFAVGFWIHGSCQKRCLPGEKRLGDLSHDSAFMECPSLKPATWSVHRPFFRPCFSVRTEDAGGTGIAHGCLRHPGISPVLPAVLILKALRSFSGVLC